MGRNRGLLAAGVVSGSWALYIGATILFARGSAAVLIGVIFPTIVTAYAFRRPGGIVAGIGGAVVNGAVLLALRDAAYLQANIVPFLVGSTTNLIVGILIGSNRSLVLQLESARERIERLATEDEMTGLHNRRYATQMLATRVPEARRHGFQLCVVTVDLDNLKIVNDTLGHAEGDRLLVAFADAASASIRTTDDVCRVGGDEFLLVLSYCGSACAYRVLDRVNAGFQERWGVDGQATFSAGVAECGPEDTVETLLERSDERMFEAKRRRKAGEPDPRPDDAECGPQRQR